MLSCGIVGLPNAGKSTLFNTLLKRQVAQVANYPFTTIEPNVGIVALPDEDLAKLGRLMPQAKLVPAAVKFIDIAGLVKNAHQGEGLGNQFLAKIKETDALVHLVRGFTDKSVAHYYGSLDPKRDKEIVELELALAAIKKPTLLVLNVDKDALETEGDFLKVNAKSGEGIDALVKAAFQLLDLITFYSLKGGQEITAWSLQRGDSALAAAAKVHSDMARGFIKAEVVALTDLLAAGGWQQARASGKIRLEGKDYPIKNQEVVEFKFSV